MSFSTGSADNINVPGRWQAAKLILVVYGIVALESSDRWEDACKQSSQDECTSMYRVPKWCQICPRLLLLFCCIVEVFSKVPCFRMNWNHLALLSGPVSQGADFQAGWQGVRRARRAGVLHPQSDKNIYSSPGTRVNVLLLSVGYMTCRHLAFRAMIHIPYL